MRTPRARRFTICAVVWLSCVIGAIAQTVLVQPYVQPGEGMPEKQSDAVTILWLTDQKRGEFVVEFSWSNAPVQRVVPGRVVLDFAPPKPKTVKKAAAEAEHNDPVKEPLTNAPVEASQHYFKYAASLTNLPLNTHVTYVVKLAGEVIRASAFPTRASGEKSVRFVLAGDLANGKAQQNAIAFQMTREQPDFAVLLGDIVYPIGRVRQYMDHFWGTYNQPRALSISNGAPLMASTRFHAVIGNHDVDTHNLNEIADVLGAYHFFKAPANGPGEGPWTTPIGKTAAASQFRSNVGASYPQLGFYSFDWGPVHFLILDTSGYVNLENPKLRQWMEQDLKGSTAPWKLVCTHNPLFHSARDHYTEQKTRLLAPLLQESGVDMVFSGHVHHYQRSVPMRFTPNPPKRLKGGFVNGDFQLDTRFDGLTNTRPDGIIHVVAGGGGGTLYRADLKKNAAYFATNAPGNWVPFTAKLNDQKHSFCSVEATPEQITVRAIDLNGGEIDRFTINKSKEPFRN